MIIDFHTHCFPDKLAERVVPMLARKSETPYFLNGKLADLRGSMDRNAISASVLLQIATKPSQTPTVNAWAIEQNAEDIIGFGSVHPDYPEWRHELKRIADAGLKGIKLHPDYQDFFVDEEHLAPLYEYAIELGLIIVFHAGVDIGFPPPVHCTPDRLLRVLDILRHGKIVLAHMGGWKMWGEVEEKLAGGPFYFDTSFCSDTMPDADFTRLIDRHGAEKILLGSDSPWDDQSVALRKVRGAGLPAEVESAILGGNARRLLEI